MRYFNLFKLKNDDTNTALTFAAVNGTPMMYVFNRESKQGMSKTVLKMFFPSVYRLLFIRYLNDAYDSEAPVEHTMMVTQMYPETPEGMDEEKIPNKKIGIAIGKNKQGKIYVKLLYLALDNNKREDVFEITSQLNIVTKKNGMYNHADVAQNSMLAAQIFVEFLETDYQRYIVKSKPPTPDQNGYASKAQANNRNNNADDDIPF